MEADPESKEPSKSVQEPLNKQEREALSKVSDRIREAAENNDAKTVSDLRRQLIDAAKLGILGPEDTLDAALGPMFKKEEEK